MSQTSSKFKIFHLIVGVIILAAFVALGIMWMNNKKETKATLDASLKEQILAEKTTVMDEAEHLKSHNEYEKAKQAESLQKLNILDAVRNGNVDALVFGMWEANEFSEEFFKTYYGLNPAISPVVASDPDDFGDYLGAVSDGTGIKDVFIRLDPIALCENYLYNHRYEEDDIAPYIFLMQEMVWNRFEENKDVTFHIYLINHPISYWSSLSEEEYWAAAEIWYEFIKFTNRYSNVVINTMASDTWLIENTDNFDESGRLKEQVAATVLRLESSDRSHVVDVSNFYLKWNILDETASVYRETDNPYPDLSGIELVFIGDSVITGNSDTVNDIPEYISSFSGARVYNLSNAFATAAKISDGNQNIVSVARGLSEGKSCEDWSRECIEEFSRYLSDSHEGVKTVFVISSGMSDYICNVALDNNTDKYDETTLCGALRISIENLLGSFEGSDVLVMTPCYISNYNEGKNSPIVDGVSLTDIIEAEHKVAKEEDTYFINSYEKCYLADIEGASNGLVPTNESSYRLSKMLMKYVKSVFVR